MRALIRLLAALGIYITVALPGGLPAAGHDLQHWICPPAIAATVAGPPPTAVASDDGWIWKDYQDPDTEIQPKQPLWLEALGAMLKLAFVIALAYAVLYGYKRLLGIRAAGSLGGRIRVLESTRLAGTQSLVLVEANERYMLLGSNGAGVLVKLMEWPVTETGPAPEEAAFARALTQAATRGPQASPPTDFDDVVESTIRQVTRRIEGEA